VLEYIQLSAWTPTGAAANVQTMHRAAQPNQALAVAIRRLREERGLTREAVAFQAGITNGALARIELAKSAPRWSTVVQIAHAMNVPLVVLAQTFEKFA
jgi:DNA-binding XRE family transcriptional regulator